ncbi:hypothetical protein KY290_031114 [Solanum tuberosum]|uniref:Polyprotein protein n=1 Tax=Solanum tuberosum TaxID=4113 RepID=A0ABQ7U8F1_SOLTU|nr:hypothetical protein KY290_031114 [Solanum tuberosum]
MIDKDELNVVANIIIPIENPEENGSHGARTQAFEGRITQVQDLAKLSATTFPTFKTPIYFPKANLPSADLPNLPEPTQHAPAHGRVPPASPTAVKIVPDLSNRDPTISTMNQILGAHVAAPYEPHVPLVYDDESPTIKTPVVVNILYEVDQYVEMEKDTRLKEDASINAKLHSLRKALKNLQVTRRTESLDYDDMCIHPDIDLPVG